MDQHKDSFNAATNYFFKTYGLIADEKPSNHRSLCFFSHDPHAFVRNGLVQMFQPHTSLQLQGNTVTQTHSNAVTQIHRDSEEYNNINRLELVKRAKEKKDKVEKWINDPRTPPELVSCGNSMLSAGLTQISMSVTKYFASLFPMLIVVCRTIVPWDSPR